MHRELLLNNSNGEEYELFDSLLKREHFCRSMPVFSCEYSENQWTARLCECLKHNKIECEYTAHLRGNQTKDAWKHRLPQGISKESLIFRGSPDIIINRVKGERNEGLFSTIPAEEESGDDDEDPMDSGSQTVSSEHSAKFQMGHQTHNYKAYKGGSFIPDKSGELVGALHLSLVCRALRRYTEGKTLVFPLVGHGLQIHRGSGIIHMTLIFSKDRMRIKAKNIFDGQLSPEYLCSCITYFIDKLKQEDFKDYI